MVRALSPRLELFTRTSDNRRRSRRDSGFMAYPTFRQLYGAPSVTQNWTHWHTDSSRDWVQAKPILGCTVAPATDPRTPAVLTMLYGNIWNCGMICTVLHLDPSSVPFVVAVPSTGSIDNNEGTRNQHLAPLMSAAGRVRI